MKQNILPSFISEVSANDELLMKSMYHEAMNVANVNICWIDRDDMVATKHADQKGGMNLRLIEFFC